MEDYGTAEDILKLLATQIMASFVMAVAADIISERARAQAALDKEPWREDKP
jgi:hypothetical protein